MNKRKLSELKPETLRKAIDTALTAPFPQIAVHHLIDRLFENFEPVAEAGDVPPRCKKCNSPFLPHHKIHTVQDVGGFYHTGCMPSPEAGDTKSGCCEGKRDIL